MRPVQATGRAGTPVIPAKWSEAPRTVVAKTWTSACSIRHPGGVRGAFNETTGTYPVTPHSPHHTGRARLQVLDAQERKQLVAEDPVTSVAYRVSITVDATAVQVEDVVTVTCLDANGDPTLEDRELVVKSFARGSLAWERDLICIDTFGD